MTTEFDLWANRHWMMLNSHQIEAGQAEIEDTHEPRSVPGRDRKPAIRVYLMDLWSFIPYYMARLCAALRQDSVQPTLGSVRYHLDRKYFQHSGVVPDQFLLDFGGGVKNRLLRRSIKSVEYLINICVLGGRLAFLRPDILHVQYLPFLEHGGRFEIWFLKWMRSLGIKIVYTVHNVTQQDAPEARIPLLRRVYHAADGLICHGENARTDLVDNFGVPAERIRVIPHGPLFESCSRLSKEESRSKLGFGKDEIIILSLGVISEYKGIPFLLDAWKKLKEERTRGRLVIAGTGDPRILAAIQEKVVAENLSDSVSLRLEFIPVEQLPLFYQAADILVFPYKAGTTSGALLTALNYGKAMVATNLPFFQEYLRDKETALLLDYGDEESLKAAMTILIDNPQYRTKIASELSRQTLHGTGWDEIARKTEQFYEAVLDR